MQGLFFIRRSFNEGVLFLLGEHLFINVSSLPRSVQRQTIVQHLPKRKEISALLNTGKVFLPFAFLLFLNMLTITLKPLQHRNAECIGIYFTGNQQITKSIKALKGIKWSQTNKCWYLLLNKANYNAICKAIGNAAQINNTALRSYLEKKKAITSALQHTGKTAEIKKTVSAYRINNISTNNAAALTTFLQQLQLKSYSASTIRTYQNEFCQLLQTIKNKDVNSLTPDDLKRYMVYAMQNEGISENTAHSRLNALKFYFEQVLGREKFFLGNTEAQKTATVTKSI